MSNPISTPRSFAAVISALRYGELGDELTAAPRDLVHSCSETGRAGKLTLTLTLKPGKGRHFSVIDDFAVKKPKAEKGESLLFPTPDGYLTRDDPKQMKIEGLTVIDRSTGEIIDVTTQAKAS